MTLLQVDKISIEFGGLKAVNEVSFTVDKGQIVSIIGPNGAGKTTLSEILVGGIVPQQGDVFLDGYVYKSIAHSELKRSIGYVPQQPHFFKGTIRDNILIVKGNIKEGDVVATAGLSFLVDKMPVRLMNGQ